MRFISIETFCGSVILTLLLAACVSGQCLSEPKLRSVTIGPGANQLTVLFDNNTDFLGVHSGRLPAATDANNWSIISPQILLEAKTAGTDAQKIALLAEAMPDIGPITSSGGMGLIFSVSTTLRPDTIYTINVRTANTFIAGDCVGQGLEFKLPNPGTAATPAKKSKTILAEVKKRENADIYIEGIAEGARGAKTGFTVDASVSKAFRFQSGDPDNTWKPFFEIKASTNEKADPNSLAFGVKFKQADGVSVKQLGLSNVFLTETARFEADRDFKNINLVGDFRMHFVSDFLANVFEIVPFIGMEVGKNLRSPLEEAEGHAIARPLVGANLYYRFYPWNAEKGEYQKAFSWETRYERRWLLTREVTLDTNDAGDLLPLRVSRAPRDYIKNSLGWDFAKNFGFKVNHEYGSLPPLFKVVDHKFSVGLVFQGVFEPKK